MPKEHHVVRQAHADGSGNLPESDERSPNAIETQIIEGSEQRLGELRRHAQHEIERCRRELEKQELTPVDLDIAGPADEATHAFAMIRGTTRDALLERRKRERELYLELRHFKAENGLYRSALYVKSRILALSLLLALITGEAILNAKLFAYADPLGLLGGWLQAIIVSVLNVLPSFLVGIVVLRNLHHVSVWRRLLAAVVLLPYLGLILGYNLLIGHYRVALATATDPEGALTLAIPSLWGSPFLIATNLEALILFGIGLFAATVAALDGYCLFDDRYPGYGKIDRRYRDALTRYEATKARFRRDIEKAVAKSSRKINRRLTKLKRKVDRASRVITKGVLCLSDTQEGAGQTAFECERLLRVYREENKRVRTAPPPTYFETYPRLATDLGVSMDKLVQRKRSMHEALVGKMQEAAQAKATMRRNAEAACAGLAQLVEEVEVRAGEQSEVESVVPYLALEAAE